MGAKQRTFSLSKVLLTSASIGFIILCFLDVNGFIEASRSGFDLFVRNVLPVLFPFFFITGLMVESGLRGRTGTVLFLSYMCGFPASVKILSELYSKGKITRRKSIILATATSTVSPIFVIATVGIGLFSSVMVGIIIFVAMVLGALLNGLLYYFILRKKRDNKDFANVTVQKDIRPPDSASIVATSLQNALQSIMAVGGMIVVFYILTQQLANVLSLSSGMNTVLAGVMEMTAGVFTSTSVLVGVSGIVALIIVTAILTFGGLSVGMQGSLFFRKFGMSFWFYLVYKVTHVIFAVAVVSLLTVVFL